MVSILIPILNEKRYIENCIKSVLEFDLQEKIEEIFLIDGGSTDGTLKLISKYKKKDNRISILNNPKKYQSFALNRGIELSKGKYIMRLDAHSYYPKDYLKRCLKGIKEKNVNNIGGVFNTILKTNFLQEKIIQAITTHKFGVGGSNYRIKHKSGYVKTVPYGFFNKQVFDKIGLFNEELIRNQDYEFNRRMIKNGMKIWLDKDIIINYHNQISFWKFLKKQLMHEGRYNVYMWKIAPYTFTLRHSITGLFFFVLIFTILILPLNNLPFLIIISSYFILAFISSFMQCVKYKKFSLIVLLPFCFFLFHLMHGLSEIIGLIKILSGKSLT